MIDVELIAQIDKRKQQRQKREQTLIAVLHRYELLDLFGLKGQGLAAARHDLPNGGDRERSGAFGLYGFPQRG